MRKKLTVCLLAALTLLVLPAAVTGTTASTDPAVTVSAELAVDAYLLAATVSTELVAAKICPVITQTCNRVNQVCGPDCHCKAGGVGGSQLVCVGNPGGGPIPIK